MSDEKITGNTLSVSGKPSLLSLFRDSAVARYGIRGVSKAASEAFREWLTKRGIELPADDNTDAALNATRMQKLAALGDIPGVDVDAELDQLRDRILEREGLPRLLPTGSTD